MYGSANKTLCPLQRLLRFGAHIFFIFSGWITYFQSAKYDNIIDMLRKQDWLPAKGPVGRYCIHLTLHKIRSVGEPEVLARVPHASAAPGRTVT